MDVSSVAGSSGSLNPLPEGRTGKAALSSSAAKAKGRRTAALLEAQS
jgi:hypothetical protein